MKTEASTIELATAYAARANNIKVARSVGRVANRVEGTLDELLQEFAERQEICGDIFSKEKALFAYLTAGQPVTSALDWTPRSVAA